MPSSRNIFLAQYPGKTNSSRYIPRLPAIPFAIDLWLRHPAHRFFMWIGACTVTRTQTTENDSRLLSIPDSCKHAGNISRAKLYELMPYLETVKIGSRRL